MEFYSIIWNFDKLVSDILMEFSKGILMEYFDSSVKIPLKCHYIVETFTFFQCRSSM